MQDIRLATVLVIRKGGKYLSRVEIGTGRAVWDPHLSDAWRTRDKVLARMVAEKFEGELMLFNPVVWKMKEI